MVNMALFWLCLILAVSGAFSVGLKLKIIEKGLNKALYDEGARLRNTLKFTSYKEISDPMAWSGLTTAAYDQAVNAIAAKHSWTSTAEGQKIKQYLVLAKLADDFKAHVQEFIFMHGKGKSMIARLATEKTTEGRMDLAVAYFQVEFALADQKVCKPVCRQVCHKKCKRKWLVIKKCWNECRNVCNNVCNNQAAVITTAQKDALGEYFKGRALGEFRAKFNLA